MTQKERMILGLEYDAVDKDLAEDRKNAKELCYDINHTRPSQLEQRKEYIKKLIGCTGENCYIEPPFYCDYGYNISLGENFYCNHNLVVLDCAEVKIGKNAFIAPNVGLYTASHPIEPEKRNTFLENAQPIIIGDNVWIGGGVTVLPGVTIGDNVVIGGGSVVVKDIPSNVVAVGNPCKVVKELKINQEELSKSEIDLVSYKEELLKELKIY